MMTNKIALATCGLSLLLVAIGSTPVAAQDAVLSEFYGSGVHHYFAGNHGQAIADLEAAINGGSRDPRAYYFRGLAKSRLGYGGDSDFQTGAALETSDSDQYYPVGKALERVQGATRMKIERYRALARATAMTQHRQRNAQRYEQLRRREQQVLRAPVAAPATPATAVEPTPPVTEPAVPDPAALNPAAPGPAAATPPVAQPAVPPAPMPEPPAADDPFADDAPAQPPAADPAEPSDATPEPPVADPPAAELPADEPAIPPDDDDPFADPPASDEPADAPEAAPEPETPEEDDPFADS